MEDHALIRATKTWRSYGIDGNGPVQDTLIQDISDEHLLNIIKHLAERSRFSTLPTIYHIMHTEIAWRLRGSWTSCSLECPR